MLAGLFKRASFEEMGHGERFAECILMTKQLFEGVIADEEHDFDQFDTELDNLKPFGEKYLALQSMERSRTSASGDTAD